LVGKPPPLLVSVPTLVKFCVPLPGELKSCETNSGLPLPLLKIDTTRVSVLLSIPVAVVALRAVLRRYIFVMPIYRQFYRAYGNKKPAEAGSLRS
jgi:hypothetical protein